jgi:hypothetical protein
LKALLLERTGPAEQGRAIDMLTARRIEVLGAVSQKLVVMLWS